MARLAKLISFILMPVFTIGGLIFALFRSQPLGPALLDANKILLMADSPPSLPGGLVHVLLAPTGPILWVLLCTVWLAVLVYTLRSQSLLRKLGLGSAGRIPDRRGIKIRRTRSAGLAFALPLALAAGTVWPWITPRAPALGFLLALAMFGGFMIIALTRGRGQRRFGPTTSIGVLAGWATISASAALAALLVDPLGLSQNHAALIALLACALTATHAQLRLGYPFAYSVTVIWGLTGITFATMHSNLPVASGAAIAIMAVVIALVRVAS